MSRKILILAILVGLVVMMQPAAWCATPDLPPGVEQTAEHMLQLLDQGKFKESFSLTAPMIQKIETTDSWYGRLVSERESMGDVSSRELVSAEHVTSFADLPKGDYLKLIFKTSFSVHPESTEEVVFTQTESGEYGVAGYRTNYNRWPEALKIIGNGLFIVFFIMILLAFLTWVIGKIAQSAQKKAKAKSEKKEG